MIRKSRNPLGNFTVQLNGDSQHIFKADVLFCSLCSFLALNICIEFTCKSRDAARYGFTLTCADKQPMGTVMIDGREIQKFSKDSWTGHSPPIGIILTHEL